ncbi:MAG: hypothetical protein JWP74_1473 [Marmoricola sp.]|nr:hypothetical protein [Marmoricola sp.]
MGIATFKELCLDTHPAEGQDVNALGRFWAAATGCDFVAASSPADPGDVVGAEEGMGIALCPVPEPRTVKHRVHVDVVTDEIATLTGLGATVLRPQDTGLDESGIRWTVMADPEGGEFCAFLREPEELGAYRAMELCVDSVDADAIGGWWAEVFGVELRSEPGKPWKWIEHIPGMPMEAWVFDDDIPEPKTVKNRWHWDLYGEVDDFLERGATVLWEMPRWTVLADPEGNEFCVFPVH